MADKEKKRKEKKEKKTKPGKEKRSGRQSGDGSFDSGGGGSRGGGVLFSIISLLSALVIIFVVLFGSIFILVRINLMGVADTYKESIQRVPLLNFALPAEEAEEITFEDLMKENNALKKEIADLVRREEYSTSELERLRKFEDEYQARLMVNEEKTQNLEKQIADLQAEKRKMEETKYEIERIVAEGDKEGFAEYFEMVEPSIAREIYAQIIQEQKLTSEARDFIKLYEAVEPEKTAEIFEEMGLTRLDLIVECLWGMKKDIATEIISAMSVEFATAVTLRMAGSFS